MMILISNYHLGEVSVGRVVLYLTLEYSITLSV